MDILLKNLKTKSEVDDVIRNTEDKVWIEEWNKRQVVVLRFGKASDPVCMQLDDIVFFIVIM